MVAVSMEMNAADLSAFRAQMDRLRRELGRTPEEAVKIGMIAALTSMSASTKVAAKLRPIVKNKDARAGKDARVALYGVNKYRKGRKYFSPIYRGGEFGKYLKYISKDKVLALVGDKWVPYEAGTGEFQIPGLMQHEKRKIANRGLAKQSWYIVLQRLYGTQVPNYNIRRPWRPFFRVSKIGLGFFHSVTMTHFLDYISKAMKQGGRQSVSTAMKRAAAKMKGRIDQRIKGAIR